MHILWCRTDICSCKLSAKVSLMLGNQFPVPSLCKLNHISVCFIQISTKITYKQLIPFMESHLFFEVIPGVLGRSVNFNATQRFLLKRPVFPYYLSISYDYDARNKIFLKYRICAWTEQIIKIFITEQIQWKLISKFFFKFKKTLFLASLGPLLKFFGQKTFSKKLGCHA